MTGISLICAVYRVRNCRDNLHSTIILQGIFGMLFTFLTCEKYVWKCCGNVYQRITLKSTGNYAYGTCRGLLLSPIFVVFVAYVSSTMVAISSTIGLIIPWRRKQEWHGAKMGTWVSSCELINQLEYWGSLQNTR